jgi:hypothetical protein
MPPCLVETPYIGFYSKCKNLSVNLVIRKFVGRKEQNIDELLIHINVNFVE